MRNDFAAQAHAAVDCLDLAGACAVGHFHPAVDGIDTAGFRAFANADTAVDRIQLAVALAGFGADAAVDLADVGLGAGRAGGEQDAQQQRNGKSFHGDLDGCAAGRPRAEMSPFPGSPRNCLKSLESPCATTPSHHADITSPLPAAGAACCWRWRSRWPCHCPPRRRAPVRPSASCRSCVPN
ncbi:hypothetical protein G6F40_015644 [Rhizopus arrhizus]|nr:hypothetical protein G6F40_015644 [Rhizopus arrhizus]